MNRRHFATAFKNIDNKHVFIDGTRQDEYVVEKAMASLHGGEASWAQTWIPVVGMPDNYRICGGPDGTKFHFATQLVRGYVQVRG